jgi:deoxyribodipyrimidine photolyase
LRVVQKFFFFDERMDDWWENSKDHNAVDCQFENTDKWADTTDCFRIFNPDTKEVIFWGQRFNIRELVDEARRIHDRALPGALQALHELQAKEPFPG